MARRSGRHSGIVKESTGTSETTQSAKRRPASTGGSTKPAKLQKTQGTSKSTPTKSRYFKQENKDGSQTEDSLSSSPEGSDVEDESDFAGDAVEDASSAPSDDDDDDVDDVSEDDKKSMRKRKLLPGKNVPKAALPSRVKGNELWREGATTGLEPGTEVVIKKPKARPAGKTPYKDDTIHPNTMLFLTDLKANNDREWLKMHDPDYRASLADFNSFIEGVTQRLVQIDETIPELPIKDIVFRIYRDIRFSPDPTPYKPYFSAAWSRTGRKGPYAAYYLQIMPRESFIGGGLWHPEAQYVAALRSDIDQRPQRIKAVLTDSKLRREFLGGVPKSEEKAVKAFVKSRTNAENALKTKPKGFDADHRDIELLRLKSFTIGRKLSNEEILGPQCIERIAELLACMLPYITYLNSVVMPDAASETESDTSESAADA